ncbi:MAG TPA: tetratricopeptide repeat protein [Jiangellaceae bacterium]
MSSQSFSRPGAVDLSSFGTPRPANGAPPAGGPAQGGGFVVDVSEATFQTDVLNRSLSVPVVVEFWVERAEPSKQLAPILQSLAAEYGGRFVLARVDVDANQAIAASAQVQTVPAVLGVLRGQAIPLFQGALPESEVRAFIDELLNVAVANGVAGRADPIPGAAGAPAADAAPDEVSDPRFDAAYEAINAGDYDAAAAAYQAVLAESPADADAKAGLAQVELLRRTSGVDATAARAAADQAPSDVDAQLVVADLELAEGRVDQAFGRLIDTVRRVQGDDRERLRQRLVELFEVVGSSDPRVTKARGALASALF